MPARSVVPSANPFPASRYAPIPSVLDDPYKTVVAPHHWLYTYTFTMDRDISLTDKWRIRRWAQELGRDHSVHVVRRDWTCNEYNCVVGFWFHTTMRVSDRVLERMQDRLTQRLGVCVRIDEEVPAPHGRY
ncbi:hypothetical protein Q8F55_006189 [Vanrija albida]|uniref:Uncharacterized protein n=1 Tax=Vanrija albida TaxID=181172 RepID=A0ABR3PWJ0_9TREE